MFFRILRRDTEIRFVTKFNRNWPLQSCRKVVWFTTQKTRAPRNSSQPHFAQNGPIAPKLLERCHPLTCPPIHNLVRIGCVLPDLFRKDWFFCPKSHYNIGFQPTIILGNNHRKFRNKMLRPLLRNCNFHRRDIFTAPCIMGMLLLLGGHEAPTRIDWRHKSQETAASWAEASKYVCDNMQ